VSAYDPKRASEAPDHCLTRDRESSDERSNGSPLVGLPCRSLSGRERDDDCNEKHQAEPR
jgi:hypothetical protein